jgi:hypothetical protein
LTKWTKVENLCRKHFKKGLKTTRTIYLQNCFAKTRGGGGGKTAVGPELSLVSGNYHENKVSVVMEMASICIIIRHVFGFTSLTERSIGAGPPVIIQLSGRDPGSGCSRVSQILGDNNCGILEVGKPSLALITLLHFGVVEHSSVELLMGV